MARSLADIPPRPTREYHPSTAASTDKNVVQESLSTEKRQECEQEFAPQATTKKLRIQSPPGSKSTPALAKRDDGFLARGSQSSDMRPPRPPLACTSKRPPSHRPEIKYPKKSPKLDLLAPMPEESKASGSEDPSNRPRPPPPKPEPPKPDLLAPHRPKEGAKAAGSEDPSPPKPEPPKPESADTGSHQEEDVNWNNDALDKEEEEQSFMQLCAMLRQVHFRRDFTPLASFTPEKENLWHKVREAEDVFKGKLNDVTKETKEAFQISRWRSSRSELSDPFKRGRNDERFRARNYDQAEIMETTAFRSRNEKIKQLFSDLYESLTNAFMTPELDGRVPEWLPLSPYSKKALSHGESPAQYPGPIKYADLLFNKNILTGVRGNGRVPSGKTCKEKPLENQEQLLNSGLRLRNAYWWIELGGFHGPNQVDIQGYCAAMHAIEQSICCVRAAFAALELIPITDLELLDKPIECEERHRQGVPVGHRAIHLCCHGIDVNKQRWNILQALIDKKVDVDAKTENDKKNTGATLIGSQGCPEMLAILKRAGADMSLCNANGLSVRQGAKQCSGTTEEWCIKANLPNTHTTQSGRTRGQHENESRLLRHAALSSFAQPEETQPYDHDAWSQWGSDHGACWGSYHGLQPSWGSDHGAWQHQQSGWNDYGSQRSADDHDAKQHRQQANWNDHGLQPSRYHRDAHKRQKFDYSGNSTSASQPSGYRRDSTHGSAHREARHASQPSGYRRRSSGLQPRLSLLHCCCTERRQARH